jgi:tRNA modification GTPase
VSGPALAALWTPPGRGAIATIRVSVEWESWQPLDALPLRAANRRPLSVQPVGRVVFGRWGVELEEDVVVCAVDRHTLEIHCHGGKVAAERILRDLESTGCRVVGWQEALRATESPLRAEILGELNRATTLQTAAILWEQADGLFESSLRALVLSVPRDVSVAATQIRNWLAWAEFGLHLTQPWRVVLAGRPNVGKSSLINAILGYTRSVVFDQPGTTRDVVSAPTAIDGWPIELSDTAGLRESTDPIESAGVDRARATLGAADLAIVLLDISQPASQSDRAIIAEHPRSLFVAHKCDLALYEGTDRWEADESAGWLRVSSKTGEGLEALGAAISRRLVPRVPPSDALVPITERQVGLLRRGLDAANRFDAEGLLQSLNELLVGENCSPKVPPQSANWNGSPATS